MSTEEKLAEIIAHIEGGEEKQIDLKVKPSEGGPFGDAEIIAVAGALPSSAVNTLSFDGHSDGVTDAAAFAIAEALPDTDLTTVIMKTCTFGADESITGDWGNDGSPPSGGKGALWQAFEAKHGDKAQVVVIPRVGVALAVDAEFVTFFASLDATTDDDRTAWNKLDKMLSDIESGNIEGRLDCRVDGFTDAHISAIAEVLPSSNVTHLTFSGLLEEARENITDAAAFAIAEALPSSNVIKVWFLGEFEDDDDQPLDIDVFSGNWGHDGGESSGGKGAIWQALQEKLGEEAQVTCKSDHVWMVGAGLEYNPEVGNEDNGQEEAQEQGEQDEEEEEEEQEEEEEEEEQEEEEEEEEYYEGEENNGTGESNGPGDDY